MIVGEHVLVWLPSVAGTDDFGNETWAYGSGYGCLTWAAMAEGSWADAVVDAWATILGTWGAITTEPWGSRTPQPWSSVAGGSGRPIAIENVLVNPSSTTYDRIEAGRPHGFECDLTLYFPREFDLDVRGALVGVRGETYRVVGDPVRYTDAALPLGCLWNLVAKVARYDV